MKNRFRKGIIYLGLCGWVYLAVFFFLKYHVVPIPGIVRGGEAGWVELAFAMGLMTVLAASYFLSAAWEAVFPTSDQRYLKILQEACRGMYKIDGLHHLLGLITHFLTMKVRVRNVAILTRRKGYEGFWLSDQRGYTRDYLEYQLEDSHPLIRHLREQKKELSVGRIPKRRVPGFFSFMNLSQVEAEEQKRIWQVMSDFQTVCCIPSFLADELKNVLLLGVKKNGVSYSKTEVRFFFQLAQESAGAIENARLFDETLHKKNELKVINEQLEYSKNKLMKALKETEVANKRLQDTQAQLIHEQKMATLGRLAASVGHEVNNPLTILSMNVSRVILKYRKDPEMKVKEVFDVFNKMERNIDRIKAVVNTLTGLLKKSEKGKFEPLSLKLVLEETLPLVQFQTYLENLSGTEVEFDIPEHIPLIRGDLERLQEVFLNLFINAYHAMIGKRHRRIRVTADINPSDPDFVTIYFADNGSGMKEEVQKKIFNYGYTTKPPGKGSGMGLYMCKYIIELHGGSIGVKSSQGSGTTFTLTLPVQEDPSVKKNQMQKAG